MKYFFRLLIFAFCLFAPSAIAQTNDTGSLTGFAKDPSGAVVVGASVTIRNNQTGQTRTQVTGSNGAYTFPLLPPGTYKVEFKVKGFETLVIPAAHVNVTETNEVDALMVVGSIEQSVTVMDSNAEAIQTQTSTMGTLVGSKQINDIPLTTRNYTQVLSLSAGVTSGVTNAANLGQGSSTLNVNGNIYSANDFQMDGQQTNNFGSGTANASLIFYAEIAIPNPDAIEEFKIQTAQYDAGSGRNVGANVEVVTKSGSNSFHGAAWEFLRNTALDANAYFNKSADLPRSVMRQNQFGFDIGGPFLRNKLFFFGSYQGTRQVNGLSSVSLSTPFLPSQLFGVDRETATAATYGSLFCGVNGGKGVNGGAVACDGSNINPVAMTYLQTKVPNGQYWIPNPQNQSGSSIFSDPATYTEDQFIANIEWLISPRNTLSERMFHSHDPQQQTIDCGALCLPGNPGVIDSGTFNGGLKLASVLTQNLVNEVNAGFTHLYWEDSSFQFVSPEQFGVTPLNAWNNQLPVITVNGLFTIGGSSTDNGFSAPTTYMVSDRLSWNHGIHSVRVGFEGEDIRFLLGVSAVARGTITFASFNDFLLGQSAAQNGTAETANPTSNLNTTGPLDDISVPGGVYSSFRVRNFATYAQDDLKLTPRLTVNAGLRWEYFGGMSDALGYVGNLSTNALNAAPIPPPGGTLAGYDVASNFPGTPPPGVTRRSTSYGQEQLMPLSNFGPRLGFAWQPLHNGNFVVRGGFGLFYQETNGNVLFQPLNTQPPNVVNVGKSNSLQPEATFQVPWPNLPALGFVPRVVPATPNQVLTAGYLGPWQTPLTLTQSLNIQYQFLPTWVLEVGYVGNRGEHLVMASEATNIPNLASVAAPITNPQNGTLISTNTPANAYLRVPWIGFAPMGVTCTCTNGDSNYHSLLVTLKKQISHGITFQAAYTYSKALTDFEGEGGNLSANSNNPSDLAQAYGPADWDRTNRFITSYTYQVPGYHQGHELVGKALTGWSVSGVTTLQGGDPLTFIDPRAGTAYYGATNTSSRAEFCPGMSSANLGTPGSVRQRLSNYTNSAAFCAPPTVAIGGPGTAGTDFGNTGRGIQRGPGQNNTDISIAKATVVGGLSKEGHVDFRAEFFNTFNHTQFGDPGTTVSTPSFGIINSTIVTPRLIQFGLKYVF
jgi:Carboxypeptidase regulatory-like domain/TonB dependent receptor